MKMMFSSKCSKYYVDLENAIKFQENVNGFEDNCVSTCCGSLCHLRREYMGSAVNMLKRGPKISDPTNRHNIQLNLFDINGILG